MQCLLEILSWADHAWFKHSPVAPKVMCKGIWRDLEPALFPVCKYVKLYMFVFFCTTAHEAHESHECTEARSVDTPRSSSLNSQRGTAYVSVHGQCTPLQ